MEEILGREAFDGDDLGPLPMDEQLPEEGETWTPPPEPLIITDDDQTGGPPARPEMNW
jgi:hypothetical protein